MSKKKVQLGKQKPRHRFFLNPYVDARFNKCPRCRGKTKVRKRPFIIHIDPRELVMFNMSGPYCPTCDLVILHKDKLENLLAYTFQMVNPTMIGNDYLVVGTVDAEFWREYKGRATLKDLIDHLHDFKEVLKFEIRWGWGPDTQEEEA